jgi:multicomponent Na+:H+ antiporter subunit B
MIEIHLVLLFMIAAAFIAVQAKDLLSSVIAVGAVGIGLSMGFLVLKAPDLAMMQLVVEILSLIILIRATIRKDLPFSTSGRWIFNTSVTLIFLVIFIVLAYISLRQLPQFGDPIMRLSETYFKEGPAITGSRNVVAAISLNFRALDTMGETVALFAAIVGILVIARKKSRE